MKQKHVKIAIELLAVVVVVICIYLGLSVLDRHGDAMAEGDEEDENYSIFEETDSVLELNGKEYQIHNAIKTYLIIGTDESGNEEAAGEEYRGAMADFMLLAVIDETNKSYGFIQLSRDTITDVTMLLHDGTGYASADMQLCTAHWYGWDKKSSCENTVDAVSRMLGGLPIDGYYSLQMRSMPELNHAVGGVTVTIEDDFSAFDEEMQIGRTMTLSDSQAFLFVRSRQGMADDDNMARMKRQRTFMSALMGQAKEQSQGNRKFIVKLYDEMADYAVTDIGSKEIAKLSQEVGGYTDLGLYTFDGETRIGQRLDDGIDHAEFYLHRESVEDILKKVYSLSYLGEASGEEEIEGAVWSDEEDEETEDETDEDEEAEDETDEEIEDATEDGEYDGEEEE